MVWTHLQRECTPLVSHFEYDGPHVLAEYSDDGKRFNDRLDSFETHGDSFQELPRVDLPEISTL